jgi:hypothetical protein
MVSDDDGQIQQHQSTVFMSRRYRSNKRCSIIVEENDANEGCISVLFCEHDLHIRLEPTALKKIVFYCLSFFALITMAALTPALSAQQPATPPAAATETRSRTTEEASVPIPPETTSVTKHDGVFGGRAVHYTATAGNFLIKDDKRQAQRQHLLRCLYRGRRSTPASRPVTFLYNGGPGSATVWLHMGSVRPGARGHCQSPDATAGRRRMKLSPTSTACWTRATWYL